jgi:DNA/RNA-binding domain of Phe-tRNA-synthetase-like protein
VHFEHSGEIWRDFPALAAGVVFAGGITPGVPAGPQTAGFISVARSRLAAGPEGEFPEIQAWRRAFSRMGLKPTQYRCASESLLRRLRTQGSLPQLHPLIDLCNAASAAFAIPVAAFDTAKITGHLEVRYATGDENYLTFSGELEHPAVHEVIFADRADQAHARRWTNRQSGLSAVQNHTTTALIVAEALHETAASDVGELITAVAGELAGIWPVTPTTTLLTASSPRFTFGG